MFDSLWNLRLNTDYHTLEKTEYGQDGEQNQCYHFVSSKLSFQNEYSCRTEPWFSHTRIIAVIQSTHRSSNQSYSYVNSTRSLKRTRCCVLEYVGERRAVTVAIHYIIIHQKYSYSGMSLSKSVYLCYYKSPIHHDYLNRKGLPHHQTSYEERQ